MFDYFHKSFEYYRGATATISINLVTVPDFIKFFILNKNLKPGFLSKSVFNQICIHIE